LVDWLDVVLVELLVDEMVVWMAVQLGKRQAVKLVAMLVVE
jgi:hypothetical protein